MGVVTVLSDVPSSSLADNTVLKLQPSPAASPPFARVHSLPLRWHREWLLALAPVGASDGCQLSDPLLSSDTLATFAAAASGAAAHLAGYTSAAARSAWPTASGPALVCSSTVYSSAVSVGPVNIAPQATILATWAASG